MAGQDDAVDLVGFFVKAVEAEFVPHEKQDQQAAGYPDSQSDQVDLRVADLFAQRAQGDFEVVLEHIFSGEKRGGRASLAVVRGPL